MPNLELLNRNDVFDDEIDTEDEECEEETLELGETESATSSVITKSEHCELSQLNEDFDDEESEEEEMESAVSYTSSVLKTSEVKLPNLTVKEKKELASYAHSLGKKFKSQQVGKSGVTDSVAFALIETLEANELLKAKPQQDEGRGEEEAGLTNIYEKKINRETTNTEEETGIEVFWVWSARKQQVLLAVM
ncbi:RNA-binding, CRM domain, partial [Dillenia turbinata]